MSVRTMTLASETMSSILQSPQSSSTVSSKSKLGFSIDSIVGAKNNVFRSDSHSPPSPRDIEHASQKLRESLTSMVSPTDLSLRGSFFDQRDSSRPPLLHHHPFGLLSSSSSPPSSSGNNNASLSFHRMAAAAMAAAAAAGGASPPRGRSRSRSRSPSEYERESRKRRFSSSSSPPPSQQQRPSSSSPNPPSSSSQMATSPQPSSHPPSLVRPIPTNGAGLPGAPNGGHPLAQSYLDHLANLKAFYDQSAAAAAISAAVSSASGNSPTTCSVSQGPPPGPHPTMGHMGPLGGGPLGQFGLHRPPGMGHPGLQHMFLGGGGPGGTPLPPQIPREYPLYPWFISRRFPGGKYLSIHLFDN